MSRKSKKKQRRLKIMTCVCVLFLLIEAIYIGYRLLYKTEESVYFEGINAIFSTDKYYIAVGSNNDNDNHYEKAKLSKYNLKKEKNFEKLYNIGFNSSFFGVAVDGNDILTVGSYEKTDEDRENSIRKALIVKYDQDGNVIFETDFGLLDNSKFTGIYVSDDGYYVTGQSIYKNTRVADKESPGGAILAKYDKNGKLLWYKTYGSNKNAIFNDLLIVDNKLYVVGTDDNYVGIIVVYDLDGNFVTYNDYYTTDSLGFSGIVSLNQYVYVVGALRRENDDNDAMIVQYNLDCTYIDQVVYRGNGIERFNKIVVDDHNYLVAIGTMATSDKKSGVGEYNYDGIIAKYDENLKYIDSASYGDDRDDYFTDIKYVNGEYLVVGYSFYDEGSYMSKFIRYSQALKILDVE